MPYASAVAVAGRVGAYISVGPRGEARCALRERTG